MSKIFAPLSRTSIEDKVVVSFDAPIVRHYMLMPMSADSEMCVTTDAPVRFASGLPFSAEGRICVVSGEPIVRVVQGVPFAASGHIVIGIEEPAYNDQGVWHTATGAIMTGDALSMIIDLLKATCIRDSERTVWGYPVDGVIADGQTLITVPAKMPAIKWGRLVTTVEGGAELGSELWDDLGVTLNNFTFDGDTYTATNAPNGSFVFASKLPIPTKGVVTQFIIKVNSVSGTGTLRSRVRNGVYSESLGVGTHTFELTTDENNNAIYPLYTVGELTANAEIISVKQVLTHWSAVDANGAHLDTSLSVEDVATNELLYSNDFDNAVWSKRGGLQLARNLVGADGQVGSGWTVSGMEDTSGATDDIFQTITGLVDTVRYEPSLVLKQISTSGILMVNGPASGVNGEWRVDLALLSADWETVDRNHPAVSIITEMVTNTNAFTLQLFKHSGTGALSVGIHNLQVELGEISTSQIYTEETPVVRQADINTVPTPSVLTPEKGAIEMVVTPVNATLDARYSIATQADANNAFGIFMRPTESRLYKIIAGNATLFTSFTYTSVVGVNVRIQFYWDASGFGHRMANAADDITLQPFSTNTDIQPVPIGTLISIGNKNNIQIYPGEYDNNGKPVVYKDAESAGWL